MGIGAAVRHYFLEAFTPYGQISLLQEFLSEMKYTYLFTGGPGTGKSTMIKLIGIELIDRGYDVDYIRSVKEPDSVAGLYLRKQKLGIFDKNEFVPEILIKGNFHREINFNSFCQSGKLARAEQKIEIIEDVLQKLEIEITQNLRKSYLSEEEAQIADLVLNKGDTIHNFLTLRKIFSLEQRSILSQQYNEIMEIVPQIQKNCFSYYFLQALRLDRWINLAPRFIKDYDLICLDNKDSFNMLPELLQEVKQLGQGIEIIVHPLNPYTMAGIVFPGKNLTVWKGNPQKLEEQSFQREHSPELIRTLEQYKTYRFDLKAIYNASVDFSRLDELKQEITSCIIADLNK